MKRFLMAIGLVTLTFSIAQAQDTLGKGCPEWTPFSELVKTHKVRLTIPKQLEAVSASDGHEHLSRHPDDKIVLKKGKSVARGEHKFEVQSRAPITMQFSFNAKNTPKKDIVIKDRTFEVIGFDQEDYLGQIDAHYIHPASGRLKLKSKELEDIDFIVGNGDFIKNITMEDLILGFPVKDQNGDPTFDEIGKPVLANKMLEISCVPKDASDVLKKVLEEKDCLE